MKYILLFSLFFMGLGTNFSAFSPYVHSKFGNEAWKIILAAQLSAPIGYFVSGFLSDRFRSLRLILIITLIFQAPAQYLLYTFEDNLLLTIVFGTATRFLLSANLQLCTIAVLEGAGTKRYGRLRSFGTISFLLIHAVLLLLETEIILPDPLGLGRTGLSARLGCFFHLLTAVVAFFIQKQRVSEEKYFFSDVLKILRERRVALFFIFAFTYYFSYQLVDFYLGQFLKETGGMRFVYAGWCLAVLFEIPFLRLTARIVGSYKVQSLFLIAILAGVIRFSWLGMEIMGVSPIPILYSQLLHGIQFTGFYMGTIYWLKAVFPDHLFGSGYGAFMILSVAAGGMTGNVVYGYILYSGISKSLFPGIIVQTAPFLPLFFSAVILQGILFFCFVFFPSPLKKVP